jgi:hypothetical protein
VPAPAAVVLMDRCMTCLNCGESKCNPDREGIRTLARVHACTPPIGRFPEPSTRSRLYEQS